MIKCTVTWRCRVGASEPVYALCPWGQKIPPINDRLEGGACKERRFNMVILFVVLVGFVITFIMMKADEKVIDAKKQEFIKNQIVWFYENIYKNVMVDLPELHKKYQRGRRIGDYNELIEDDWEGEVLYYVKRILLPAIGPVIGKRYLRFYIVPVLPDATVGDIDDGSSITKRFKFSEFVQDIPAKQDIVMFKYYGQTNTGRVENESVLCDSDIVVEHLCFLVKMLCEGFFGPEVYTQRSEDVSSPIDYENSVATTLKEMGFDARTTKASGDQGADVLAQKNGISFAIQCKMYSKPVGNKAVQEANAGRDFYSCDYGVVVSNAGFTKAARQAAHACNIILLDDNQLDKLLSYTQKKS